MSGGGVAEIVVLSTRNKYFPGTPTLLVKSIFTIASVCEPAIVNSPPSTPALNPAWACTVLADPTDHCMSPSA